jgi:WD40 repeat protein
MERPADEEDDEVGRCVCGWLSIMDWWKIRDLVVSAQAAGPNHRLTCSQLDPAVGTVVKERDPAHDAPVNRVFCVNEQLVASGDDEGVIKFWDPRQEDAVRAYTHHFDYISDFSYFEDKRQLVTTS